jgi:hypothetical protein
MASILEPFGVPNPLTELADVAKPDKHEKLSKLIEDSSGWHGQDATIARAVIMVESSGNPKANNSKRYPQYHCVGLLQICWHAWNGKFGAPTDKDEFTKYFENPQRNIRYAYDHIWKGSWPKSSSQWEAYSSGGYRRYMPNPPDPDIFISKESLIDDVTGAAGSIADAALGPLDEIASALLSADTWARLGKGALGGVLLILGTGAMVFIIANKASRSPAGQNVKKAVTVAVTKGAAK